MLGLPRRGSLPTFAAFMSKNSSLRRSALGSTAALAVFTNLLAPALSAQEPTQPRFVPTELFAVPEGLEVTVWATTPQLLNPVNMDFDAQGRLWVAEGVNYRKQGRAAPRMKAIASWCSKIPRATGKADKKWTVFIQERELALAARRGVSLATRYVVSHAAKPARYTPT